MVLANSFDNHIEYNEPLWTAISDWKQNQYANLPIAELQDYGFSTQLDMSYLDLARSFNELQKTDDNNELVEEIQQWIDESDEPDIYQTFIVDKETYDIFTDYGYITWYNEDYDLHFVGITHYGTAWSHIMGNEYPVHNKERYEVL